MFQEKKIIVFKGDSVELKILQIAHDSAYYCNKIDDLSKDGHIPMPTDMYSGTIEYDNPNHI